jgi:Schlafen, AlbA_2
MIDKSLDQIVLPDLQRLRDNRVAEGRALEYKQALPGGSDSERKEFLADVSSFANAVGGDLIYGVKEARENGNNSGIPEAVEGLGGIRQDAETLRLENMLRDGIAPRLPGVRFHWISGAPSGSVLLIRVPRSWAGPHMVTYQQHSRFYSRNAGGKYALDVFELRSAFLNSGSLSERAREFRAERLGRLVAADGPVPLSSTLLICAHAIPHVSLSGAASVDLLKAANLHELIAPIYSAGHSTTFNIDGLLTHTPFEMGEVNGYLQVFRSGIIESVDSAMMIPMQDGHTPRPNGVPTTECARQIFGFLSRVRRLLRELEIEPPASIFISLLGIKGAILYVATSVALRRDGTGAFDRDTVTLPELLLQNFDDAAAHELAKPLLDALWQAAGYPRCFDYDDGGQWKPRNY